jgi:hypothetical protein
MSLMGLACVETQNPEAHNTGPCHHCGGVGFGNLTTSPVLPAVRGPALISSAR